MQYRLELRGAEPRREVLELLALLAVGPVELDDLFEGIRNALGGYLRPRPQAYARVTLLVAPAEEQFVRRDLAARRLRRRPVEADVGHVMLAAAVRAPAHLDVHLPRQRIADVHLVDLVHHRPAQPHRGRDAELAAVRARAGDHVANLVYARLPESDLVQVLP